MNSTISFVNNGLIDLTAVTTFGVNAKENDDPFGYFGTGLKYAISILLRNNHEITIYRGLDKHVFSVLTKKVRNKEFNIICLDGKELGFTTDVGKNWKMWQVFRELYCNTMDENGKVFSKFINPSKGKTTVVVSGTSFYNEYVERDKTILSTEPKYENYSLNVHEGLGMNLFFKTIRIFDLEFPSIFTYDFNNGVTLTEDRTLDSTYTAMRIIRESVIEGVNKKYIKEFITCPQGTFESKIDMNCSETPSQEFKEVMQSLTFKEITNQSLLLFWRKRTCKSKSPTSVNKTDIEIKQLERAITFCGKLNYIVDKYRINITEDLKENVLGMAYDGEIYISRRVFMQGTKQVAATVLEEFMHLEYKYSDETYEFQTYLFDVILTLGERLSGEPL